MERQTAPLASFVDRHVSVFLAAAGPLDTPAPTLGSYDVTVILGGTATGNVLRSRLAAEVADAEVALGRVIGASAARRLSASEHDTEPSTAGLEKESEHLHAVLSHVLHPRPVDVLTAPSSRPGRRADTEDAIRFLAREPAYPSGDRLLMVTSSIYVPYQFVVAAPILLANGARYVDVIGTPTATDGPPALLAQRVAQEVHATIASAARLLTTSTD